MKSHLSPEARSYSPAPLLSANGWRGFIIALIVICVIAPIANLWVLHQLIMDHLCHLSTELLSRINYKVQLINLKVLHTTYIKKESDIITWMN